MNSLNETVDLENEVKVLNERLNMYKSLNSDLSNRIQDLKVQMGAYVSELTYVRRELLDEKSKSSEMRRYIKLLNTQCANFFNAFVTNVQQAAESGIDINISTLGIGEKDNDEDTAPANPAIDPASKFEKTISGIKDRFQNRHNSPTDECCSPNANLLNTIAEESLLPFTSTPMPAAKVHEQDENSFEQPRTTRKSNRNRSSPLTVIQTPQGNTPISRQVSATDKVYSICEDKNDDHEMTPCFVRLSRCPLTEVRLSNVNESHKSRKNTSNASEKAPSEELELPARPKRSKRPRSGTLTEPSRQRKLRRS